MKRLLALLLCLIPLFAQGANISGSSVRLSTPPGARLSDLVDGGYDVTLQTGDVITKGPYIDLRAYLPAGYVTDGSVDYTTQIQAAIDAAAAAKKWLVFPAGTYSTDVMVVTANSWIDFGTATIKKFSDVNVYPKNSLLRTTGYGYDGTRANIRIRGGILDQNGMRCSAHIVSLLYTEGMTIEGVTVRHDDGGSSTSGKRIWAMCIGGRDVKITNCRVENGDEVFQDGIHIYHGQRIAVSNCYVECGDDALVAGCEPTDANMIATPDPIRYVVFSNCVVKSNEGNAGKCYVNSAAPQDSNWEVTNVVYQGITGTSGVARNGGFVFYDLSTYKGVGLSQVHTITVANCDITVGGTSHDGVNDYGVQIYRADDVTVANCKFALIDNSGVSGLNGFDLFYIYQCSGVTIDSVTCRQLGNRRAVYVDTARDLSITNCKFKHGANAALSTIYIKDAYPYLVRGNILDAIADALYGIELVSGTTNSGIIEGNTFKQVGGATTGYGIAFVAAANTSVQVVNNDFSGVVLGTNASSFTAIADYLWTGNRGTIAKAGSRAQGTATVPNGATTVTVTHGMLIYPTAASQITVTPTNNLGSAAEFWISSVPNTTTFVITVNADPGATTATFVWSVDAERAPRI